MSNPLTKTELAAALKKLPGWKLDGDALQKTFTYRSFREAFAAMTQVAFEAESMNHHPEMTNMYDRVTFRLSTHDAGSKVTENDVKLAKAIEVITFGPNPWDE